jgi:hypothetical protein
LVAYAPAPLRDFGAGRVEPRAPGFGRRVPEEILGPERAAPGEQARESLVETRFPVVADGEGEAEVRDDEGRAGPLAPVGEDLPALRPLKDGRNQRERAARRAVKRQRARKLIGLQLYEVQLGGHSQTLRLDRLHFIFVSRRNESESSRNCGVSGVT